MRDAYYERAALFSHCTLSLSSAPHYSAATRQHNLLVADASQKEKQRKEEDTKGHRSEAFRSFSDKAVAPSLYTSRTMPSVRLLAAQALHSLPFSFLPSCFSVTIKWHSKTLSPLRKCERRGRVSGSPTHPLVGNSSWSTHACQPHTCA